MFEGNDGLKSEMRSSSHAQRRGINRKWQMANKMWQSFCAPPRRSCLSLAALLLLITFEICPVLASTKIRLGTNNDFLSRVHEDDLARPAVPWRQAISLLLDRVKQQGPSNHARSRKGSLSMRQNDGQSNMMQVFDDAAQASVLRQLEEERRTARSDREQVSNKQIAGQEGIAKDTSKGVGIKRNRRSIMSFNDIIIWGWKGVYHQCKEIERVLAPHYRVRLTLHEYMFPHTDPADDGALYILMTPHLCVDLPPHYIIWQTEQWGHHMLQVGNQRWANQRNEPNLLDFVEVFEGAVEVWDYSLVHLKNFEPIFKGKDVKFRHVPFSWFPLDPPITEGEKDIDVLFYGWIVDGSRRNKMLDELRFERNVSIHVSNMDAYREDLTKLLRRAKVILNIHAYPAKVLEICRILEAISFDIVVITEPGVEAALDAQWKDKLVFVDGMDQIVQQIEVYRSNSTLRNQVLKAATAHAKAHYSLETYLAEFLQHRRM